MYCKIIEQGDINRMVEDHQHYLERDSMGWRKLQFYIENEHIRNITFENVNLSEARFRMCIFTGVKFENVKLDYATFYACLFFDCTFANVSFLFATIDVPFFCGTRFYNTNLDEATIHELGYAGLEICSDNEMRKSIPYACPEEGSFIGWKKVEYRSEKNNEWTNETALVKLLIPEEAKRYSAGSKKCRCEFAKVLEIIDIKTRRSMDSVENCNWGDTIYKKGEMVYPDSFDDNRWNECSHGIHFFLHKQDALNYIF